ncbi:GGDEF domain-containing protein [Poseidonibacter lekithochrous]|uniref:GGDEF domain-containing protein n=1 Tax=Poseidonibacter lekithochrous TaxID=1904463 RepID=UPI0009F82388|nr:GGDEF domain-containing protein [Poseidonibacter lekithochrous]QKJ23318.1 diguanylate cyclase [Poseidonibacter lekithochrous]
MMFFLYLIRLQTNKYTLKSRGFILAITILFISGFINGNQEINSTFFLLLYPIASFSIRGLKEGLVWTFSLLLILITIYTQMSFLYNVYSFIFFCIAYFMVSYLLYWYRHYELKIFTKMFQVNKLKEELEEKNKELKRIAITDKLTNIYNRVKLDSKMEAEMNRAQRFGHGFSIIIIDIDYFKEVNDNYGHQIGDCVLIEMANLLKSHVRNTDTLGRWGGEEFLIICPETKEEGVLKLANNLQKTIEENTFSTIGSKTASFGITTYINGDNTNSILKRADDALYKAKTTGRNKVEIL